MKKSFQLFAAGVACFVSAAAFAGCGSPSSSASAPAPANTASGQAAASGHLTIDIAQIVSHPSLDAIRAGFKDCMGTLGYSDVTYDEQNPEGDQAALTSIANNFKSDNPDLVVAITTPVAQAMAQAIADRPIVFAGVTDPVAAGLVDSFEKPGGNLTGTSDYPPITDQLQLIKDLKPDAKTIGIVYASSETNAEAQTKLATDAAASLGMSVKTVAVTNSSEVQQAAMSLAGVDAFYVGNDNTVVSGVEGVVQAAEQQKVPVVTADPDSVKRGAVAAYAINQTQMGCEAASVADKILKGAQPADIPVVKMADLKDALTLTINPSVAAAQGVTIPDSLSNKPGVEKVG